MFLIVEAWQNKNLQRGGNSDGERLQRRIRILEAWRQPSHCFEMIQFWL